MLITALFTRPDLTKTRAVGSRRKEEKFNAFTPPCVDRDRRRCVATSPSSCDCVPHPLLPLFPSSPRWTFWPQRVVARASCLRKKSWWLLKGGWHRPPSCSTPLLTRKLLRRHRHHCRPRGLAASTRASFWNELVDVHPPLIAACEEWRRDKVQLVVPVHSKK